MSLPVPKLDDITFENLVEQARALIPRYAPQWTDHNLHDPGITFIDLLAWIVDQQLYQLGFVSDRHLQAFAALLGVRKQGAMPAKGLLWPAQNQVITAEADLQRATPVACLEQPDIAYLLTHSVHITTAKLQDLQTQDLLMAASTSLAKLNRQSRASFQLPPGPLTSQVLELNFDQPLVCTFSNEEQFPVAIGVEIGNQQAGNTTASSDEVVPPWGPLRIEYRTNESAWEPVTIVNDTSNALANTGVLMLEINAYPQATESRLRFRFDTGFFPVPINLKQLQVNVLPIAQLEEIQQQIVWHSNALPDQSFDIELEGFYPAFFEDDKGLNIEISEQGQWQQWRQVEDFSPCGPQDSVYRLDEPNNKIIFGNGINGRIPLKDTQIRHRNYFLSKGVEGNVTAERTWKIPSVSTQINHFGYNPVPTSHGENAWDVNRILSEARKQMMLRDICLSNEDLQRTALELPGFGVDRAQVISRYHPGLPEYDIGNARTVVIVRDTASRDWANYGSDYLERAKQVLTSCRVLGERLTVVGARELPLDVQADLLVDSVSDSAAIQADAVTRLKARLSISKIHPDVDPWQLGRDVYVQELRTLLANIDGVIAVPVCEISIGGSDWVSDKIIVAKDTIAVAAQLQISVNPIAEQ
jgi:hypothetical protein